MEEKKEIKETTQEEQIEENVEFYDSYPNAEYVEGELKDEQVDKMLNELKTGKRFFEIEGKGKFYIRTPTVEEIQKASLVYAKAFNEALKLGLDLQEVLEKEFVKRDILEDESDPNSRSNILRQKLIMLEKILASKNPEDKSKKTKKLAKELADVRNELIEIQVRKQQLLSSSAEAKAEDARNNYFISQTTYHEDGTKVWETYEDFLAERDMLFVARISYEYYTFSYGLSSNYLEEFPEVKFLRENNEK